MVPIFYYKYMIFYSSPPSLPTSQPPTREASPSPQHAALNNARTPPPKRWKRSFDMTHHPASGKEQPLPLVSACLCIHCWFNIININNCIAFSIYYFTWYSYLLQLTEKYSLQNIREYEHHNGNASVIPGPAKRFCEPSQTNGDISTTAPSGPNGHAINGRSVVGGTVGHGVPSSVVPGGNNSRSLPYPHSMPTSPTMFERGNEIRLVS